VQNVVASNIRQSVHKGSKHGNDVASNIRHTVNEGQTCGGRRGERYTSVPTNAANFPAVAGNVIASVMLHRRRRRLGTTTSATLPHPSVTAQVAIESKVRKLSYASFKR